MPSNALKISQLVERLNDIKAVHGDLDVVLALPRAAELLAVDGENMGVAVSFPWGRVPGPVLAFGVWSDPNEKAALALPGKPYQYTETIEGFTFDRHSAPAGVELILWTRNSSELLGKREGEDRWFVADEAGRWIEYVPRGVLGWRLP